MSDLSRSLIPAAAVPPGNTIPTHFGKSAMLYSEPCILTSSGHTEFTYDQVVRIRATIHGYPSKLEPRDRDKVIKIVLRFKRELHLKEGEFLVYHVIKFLEFEYSDGESDDVWEMYKASFNNGV